MSQAGLDPMPQHASSHSEVARYLKVWETVWGQNIFIIKSQGLKLTMLFIYFHVYFSPAMKSPLNKKNYYLKTELFPQNIPICRHQLN